MRWWTFRVRPFVLAGLLAAAGTFADPHAAPTSPDFYRGKTVSVVIGYPPGGGFDTTARLLIRHMPRHLPGHPTMIAKNMPGAGSLRAANYLFGEAPRDGTEFGIIGPAVPFGPLWSRDGVAFEATKFSWLGSLDRWTSIAFVWHAAKAQSLDAATRTEVVVGATGAGDMTVTFPRLTNALLGTKFKIVPGYQGTPRPQPRDRTRRGRRSARLVLGLPEARQARLGERKEDYRLAAVRLRQASGTDRTCRW